MVEASAIGQSRDVLAQAVVVLVVGFELQKTVFFLLSSNLLVEQLGVFLVFVHQAGMYWV